jgi:alpha,alpha-trehalose phosphorylase
LFRGRRLKVEVVPGEATYELVAGDPLDVVHHGRPARLEPGRPTTLSWVAPPPLADVGPPVGREPSVFGVGAG